MSFVSLFYSFRSSLVVFSFIYLSSVLRLGVTVDELPFRWPLGRGKSASSRAVLFGGSFEIE
jgi:hypothetical protein